MQRAFNLMCRENTGLIDLDIQMLGVVDEQALTLLVSEGPGSDYNLVVAGGRTTIDLTKLGTSSSAVSFAKHGFQHVLMGADHLVFLIFLLLPEAREGSIKQRFFNIAPIVTAFTLLHSITLTVAACSRLSFPVSPSENSYRAECTVSCSDEYI